MPTAGVTATHQCSRSSWAGQWCRAGTWASTRAHLAQSADRRAVRPSTAWGCWASTVDVSAIGGREEQAAHS